MAAENENCSIFDNLSTKFTCLLYGRTDKQKEHISKLLSDLNDLNYKLPIVTNNNKAVLLIHQCCQVITPTDIVLVKKCCMLIVNLLSIQKIILEGRTLSFTVDWIIQSLKHPENSKVDILKALESLIRDNVQNIQDFLPYLIGQNGILPMFSQPNTPQDVQFWAVKCLESLVFMKDNQSPTLYPKKDMYLQTCSKIFLKLILEDKPSGCDEFTYCKLQTSCLRGLHYIISQNPAFASQELDLLLGICKYNMTYCLFNSEWIKPQKIMPSNLSVADLRTYQNRDKKGGKQTKQRKQRKSANKKNEKKVEMVEKKNDYEYTPTSLIMDISNIAISDSDYSDSENGKKNKITHAQSKVRQAALNLLLTIIKVTDKHIIVGYWSSFIPDGSPSGNHNLNQCLLMEPSPRSRIASLNVISTLLNDSKPYLSQAEYSTKTFAFTPFSITLGTMIKELHKCLCTALNDNFLPALTQTLKCLSLLVQVTPYHKLEPGLITLVISNVKPFIRHRDASVQVAALIVLGCTIASEPIVPETIAALTQYKIKKEKIPTPSEPNITEIEYADFSFDEEEIQTDADKFMPWLLEKCLRNLGIKFKPEKKSDNIVPTPVKLESLQIISVMCRNYFYELLSSYLLQITTALEISLCDKYSDMKLHTGRTIDSIGQAMQLLIATPQDDSKHVSIDKGIQFWQNILTHLVPLTQDEEHPALRAIACDCLGSIGPDIFEHLSQDKRILVVSLLLSHIRDADTNVQGAAVRALAISVLYPSLREDHGFVMDTAEAILCILNNPNLNVKIKASWSLGNLSDALVLMKNSNTSQPLEEKVLLRLLQACISMTNDNDKVKSNIARALGNFLRLVTPSFLKYFNNVNHVQLAITALIKMSYETSNMKVSWNCCYAIGNFLRNEDLYINTLEWTDHCFNALMRLVVHSHNFKVRINAALALSVPIKKQLYGPHYFPIWKSLLDALEYAYIVDDFSEYKHRDNLVDQICLSLGHLTTLLEIKDLKELNFILDNRLDSLSNHMHRVQERLVPEKFEILIRASDHIKKISDRELSNDDKNIINSLINIFEKNT